jgi:hypothetical protein
LIDVALNQRPIAESLSDDGYCIYLGLAREVTEEQVSDTVRALAVNPRLLRSLACTMATTFTPQALKSAQQMASPAR